MIRIAAVVLLLGVSIIHAADEKKKPEPVVAIERDAKDDFGKLGGKVAEPTVVTTEKELETAIPDETTRNRIAKLIDFKTQTLLIFAWKGSGKDKLGVLVQESEPPTLAFSYERGLTKDLRSHVYLYAIGNTLKYTVK
jgi:hypothetical protein